MSEPSPGFRPNGHPPLPGATASTERWWDDDDFQDRLCALLVNDQRMLQECASLLDEKDFKPLRGSKHGLPRQVVIDRALEHFKQFREPLGALARVDILEYAASISMGAAGIDQLKQYLDFLAKIKLVASDSIAAKVITFKAQKRKAAALQEMAELQLANQLSDEKWLEITRKTVISEEANEMVDAAQWPEPLAPAAFHGLVGEVVRAVEPNTESDPAALVIQFLVAIGNVFGRTSYWQVEATRHYLNLFTALVGQTSKARKGTSLDRVLDLFEDVDPDWLANRRMGGLSTGEGLIKEVRDPVTTINKNGDEVVLDQGATDKRLLIVEPEFARVLKVGEREAATLPSILRDAWDGRDLRTIVKENAQRATGPHVSMITHITETELQRTLSDTNRSNGFANRFLWFCVRRSKSLPLGGAALPPGVREKFVARISDAVEHAGRVGCMSLGRDATALWKKVYAELSEGLPGMLGAATDRAEAQVRRIACLYALIDCERFVHEKHLRAALAVWRYSFDSAKFLFGTSLGNPIADTILKELRRRGTKGLSRNEIRKDLFNQNKSSEAIGHALRSLQKRGAAVMRADAPDGAGRPAEHWYAVLTPLPNPI